MRPPPIGEVFDAAGQRRGVGKLQLGEQRAEFLFGMRTLFDLAE